MTITITGVNDAPVAEDGEFTVLENGSYSGALVGWDPDAAHTPTYAIVTGPAHGTLTAFNGDTGAFTYEPDTDYTGGDHFTFVARDPLVDSNEATMTITVEPTAVHQIVDDGDIGYSTTGAGWIPYSRAGYQGDLDYVKYPSGTNTARWELPVGSGSYEVYVTWLRHDNRASNAPYVVYDGAAPLGTVRVDQRENPNDVLYDGQWWYSLGEYQIDAGLLAVQLSDAGVDGQIIADAVYVVSSGPPAPEIVVNTTSVAVPESGTGTFHVKLNYEPTGEVVVSAAHVGGDGDVTVAAGASLTFTSSNWDDWQPVALSAADDPDDVNGEATIRLSASGLAAKDVAAVEVDDDDAGPWIVDDGDAGYSTTGSGWIPYSGAGYQGDLDYVKYPSGTNTARWELPVGSGSYEVYVTWLRHDNRASNAPYVVYDGAAPVGTAHVNQRENPNDVLYDGQWWHSLGEYQIDSGLLAVQLSDAGVDGQVIADAIYVVRVS